MRQLLSSKSLLLLGILLMAPLYASEFLYEEDFENGLGGFVIDNAFGNSNGLWRLSTACESALGGHSAVTALGYAQDSTCNYNNGVTNQGVATSPGIQLPTTNAPIALKVKYFLQTEGWLGVADIATVEISQNGGLFTVIARNDTGAAPVTLTDGSGVWLEMTADLTAYAGSSIQLRFGFDTTDNVWNGYAGFYVDDITIFAPLYYEDFESGLGGFVIDNNYGNGSGLWHLSTACQSGLAGHSATTALAYAQDGTCTYDNGVTNQGVATSPGILLPGSTNAPIALKIKYFLQTEGWLGGADIATVEISQNGGLFTVIARNDTGAAPVTLTDGSGVWLEMTADLTAYAGSSIQLRFGFDTMDSILNGYAGFYVDDITIYTPPVYEEDFENGLGGFVINNSYGNGNGLWHLSTVCESALSGHSAITTLGYAKDFCYFDTGTANQGIADSPYIDLSPYPNGTFKLIVKYFLQTENFAGFDRATVEVSPDGGPFETIAVNYSGAWPVTLMEGSGIWQEMTADLTTYAGSEIQLRFGFDTGDAISNFYAGFYVDDITIESVPCLFRIIGDINGDCRVTLADIAMMAQNWLLDCLVTPTAPGCTPVY